MKPTGHKRGAGKNSCKKSPPTHFAHSEVKTVFDSIVKRRVWNPSETSGCDWLTTAAVASVVLSGILTFAVSFCLGAKVVEAITAGALVASLVAITWYSVETRSLRVCQEMVVAHQERDSEIRQHPWLHVAKRKSDPFRSTNGLLTTETIFFDITNKGNTPAFNVETRGKWIVEAPSDKTEADIEKRLGVLLPNTSRELAVTVQWELVTRKHVYFDLVYDDYRQGGGRLSYWYEFEQPDKVTEMCECMDFWLSDGTRFPTSPTSTLNVEST